MDDILSGLPKEIPFASLPRLSQRAIDELRGLGISVEAKQLTEQLIDRNLEALLLDRLNREDEQAPFQLGQLYFEKKEYTEAWKYFNIALEKCNDPRAKYQIGVMLYDNMISGDQTADIGNPQVKACNMFNELTELEFGPQLPIGQRELAYYAAYNLGRAYYQGFGFYPSVEKALEYFLLAANNGDKTGCIYAQTALGYLYSGPELRDLEKAFYWHSEACGNGSVESQAAIGVMYLYGLGVEQDWTSALICLSESANRGSLYAKATLAYFYYKRKMFTNAAVMANKVAFIEKEENELEDGDTLKNFHARARAMACFIYAQCLHQGLGVKKDEALAKELYSRSIKYDATVACRYQRMVQHNEM